MRITSIALYSSNLSEPISFSISPFDEHMHYIVRNIVGLDAEEITPKFYGFSLYTKSRFYDFSLKPRDIVMRVVLSPKFELGESYSDVRDDLYKAIAATRTGLLQIQFNAGATVVAQLFGNIIKFEAVYFEKVPEVQITIRCNDPIFRGINPIEIESGFYTENPIHIYDSLSTAPHGFKTSFTFFDTEADFTIQDRSPNREWAFIVTPDDPFQMNDVLYFSSDLSDKYLYVIRDGETTQEHLIDKINPSAIWPILFPGDNQLYFPQFAYVNIEKISYYPAYWGV